MKVKFLKLIDAYELNLRSEVTGKRKEDYIGQIGRVISRQVMTDNTRLYSVKFQDGQVWCLEATQFEKVED